MKLKRNIPLMYIIGSLMWGRFFIPVLALFYVASQVTLGQFGFIMGVFSLSILLFEIPTGAMGDLIGRRNTLLISRFMYMIEISLIAFFNGFWIFLIAKIISGIGVSLASGTGQAMLYDTLKTQRRKDKYKKISGSIGMISNISMAVVFITGAFLFSLNTKLPAIASIPLVGLGLILTFFLEEPPVKKKKHKKYTTHIKESLAYFKRSDFIKYLAVMSFFTSAAISIMFSMSSAYISAIAFPVYIIGTLAFISSLVMAFGSKKAHIWEKILGEKKSIFFIKLGIVIALFASGLMIRYVGYIFYLLIPLIAGFEGVVIGDYVNKHLESSHRATVLSIKSMFSNLSIFLLFPLVGFMQGSRGLGFSIMALGAITAVGFLALYIYSKILKLKIN
jgi:MFS family permease